MANSVDPDQTAPMGAVCSGSTLFASILNSSVMLGKYFAAGATFSDAFFLSALRVRKLPFPSHLGKYLNKIGKISAKIHEIGKIKAIFGLGMTPIYGLENGQIKSLFEHTKHMLKLMGKKKITNI